MSSLRWCQDESAVLKRVGQPIARDLTAFIDPRSEVDWKAGNARSEVILHTVVPKKSMGFFTADGHRPSDNLTLFVNAERVTDRSKWPSEIHSARKGEIRQLTTAPDEAVPCHV